MKSAGKAGLYAAVGACRRLGPEMTSTCVRNQGWSESRSAGLVCAALLAATSAPVGAWAADRPAAAESGDEAQGDLTSLPLEDLMNLEVTSVSKKPQRLSQAASAVYVITREDIRRSGMTSIADVLRMVPGLDVAQSDSRHWAISARGFNDAYSDKLLVMVDGRSVYMPISRGVLWDMQDLPLENIERIEVIRGPGGTIWGANAVNGVINIITMRAQDTPGPAASVSVGSDGTGPLTVRYGGALSDGAHFRVYVTGFDRAPSVTSDGADAGDGWRGLRTGARLDWAPSTVDEVSVQGAFYAERMSEVMSLPDLLAPPEPTATVQHSSGGHAILAWTHHFSPDSDTTLQAYYDRVDYEEYLGRFGVDAYDVEARHRIRMGRHEVVWGAGFHSVAYTAPLGPYITLVPPQGDDQVFNLFAQDEIDLGRNVHLIAGAKLEHNTYTGWENEPSLRVLWQPSANHTLWAAVARAIRTPSIGEEFIRFNAAAVPGSPLFPPVLVAALGNPGAQQSERLVSWEAGYRGVVAPRLSLDLSVFYNRYSSLASISTEPPVFELVPPPPHLLLAYRYGNLLKGETYGLEATARWQVTPRWRLVAGYSLLLGGISSDDPSLDMTVQRNVFGRSPRHQVQLHSYLDLPGRTELDAALYHVSALTADAIPAYTRVDLRLGWQATDRLAFSLSVRNLLQSRHSEFVPIYYAAPTQIPRTVSFAITAGF